MVQKIVPHSYPPLARGGFFKDHLFNLSPYIFISLIKFLTSNDSRVQKGYIMTREEMLADIKSGRRKKLILDTDTYNEIDDQFALTWCYLSDNIDLMAVNAAPFNNPNRC